MRINLIKIGKSYHENFNIPETCENFLCRKEKTFYGVPFIHYELWIDGENKTEINVKLDQLTYI